MAAVGEPDASRRQATRHRATLTALAVRNAVEDLHAAGAIPDGAMPEFNRSVRDAVYTTLSALGDLGRSEVSREYLEALASQVPGYWEAPALTPEYVWWAVLTGERTAEEAAEVAGPSPFGPPDGAPKAGPKD